MVSVGAPRSDEDARSRVRRAATIEDVDRGVQIGRALGQALGDAERVSGAQEHVQSPRLDVGRVSCGASTSSAGAIGESYEQGRTESATLSIGRAGCYARSMERTLRGLWLEVRVIPVLLWSFSALTVGTALGADRAGVLDHWYYVGAITLGVLIQGLLAHTVNEIEDWRSGTDRDPSPRMLSGGSKVIVNGLLSARALRVVFLVALAADHRAGAW